MCSVRFVDFYVRFGVNITPADLLVAGVFTTMHALFFDHLVFGVSHTATSTSVHYSFPTLLFPGVWGSCCFVLPRWSVEEFHTPSIFLLND